MNTTTPSIKWARKAVDYEIQKVESSSRIDRRKNLLSAAASLNEIVASGLLDQDYVDGKLTSAGLKVDIPLLDVKKSLRWGAKKGHKNPRTVPEFTELQDITSRRLIILDWYQVVMNDSSVPASAKMLAWSFARIALLSGKTRISMSIRQLSLDAGVDPKTVYTGVKNLGGHLLVAKNGNRLKAAATTWQLAHMGVPLSSSVDTISPSERRLTDQEIALVLDYISPSSESEFSAPEILDPCADLWSSKKNAWLVYHTILAGFSGTSNELAAHLGLSKVTSRSALDYLVKMGLIEPFDDGSHEPVHQTGRDLREVNEGKRKKKLSERFRIDRVAFKKWQTHKAEVVAIARRRQTHATEYKKSLRASASRVVPILAPITDALAPTCSPLRC